MTRGTLYLIMPNKKTHQSIEFNGDMYGSPKDNKDLQDNGHYSEAVALLKNSHDLDSFTKELTAFNDKHFQYKEELIYPFKPSRTHNDKLFFDFTIDYFNLAPNNRDCYFSDYLYFKNISGAEVYFKDKETKEVITLPNNQIATWNYGEFIEIIK